MKIFAYSSKVVKRAVKAVIALSLVIVFLLERGINHLYDFIFLIVFVYLIIKYYSIED